MAQIISQIGHLSVYNLASNSLDHVSNWKCVVLKSGHNFGQMSFFSGTLIRTDVAFGQMSLSDRSRVTLDDVSGSPSTVLFTNESCLENEADAKKIAKKLHEQFAHPSSRRLIKLIKDGGVVNQSLNEKIEDVEKNCHICRKFKKKPLKPVVCFPRAKTFNENLAIDLKCFSGKYMLHILDQFTRFSRTIVINDKKCQQQLGDEE